MGPHRVDVMHGRYPNAKRLMITADGGGSNGVRLWKIELRKFVDEIGIPVMVCHLPPALPHAR